MQLSQAFLEQLKLLTFKSVIKRLLTYTPKLLYLKNANYAYGQFTESVHN